MSDKEFLNRYKKIITPEFCAFFRGQRVLISGASGLLGMHFASLFQVFNRYFQGEMRLTLISKTGEFPFELSKYSEFLKMDLTQGINRDSMGVFDTVIHAAGYGQPSKFLSEKLKTIYLNTATTIDLSRLVKPNGSFLFISTSEVYSGLSNPPFRESQIGLTNTNHPRSSYIESKRAGEAIVAALKSEFPTMIAASARLALAYGPGTKPGDSRVLYELLVNGLMKGEIVLRDSGAAFRTYCFVSDAIEQCIAIIMKAKENIYNVGGRSRLSIGDLAEQIGAILDVPVRIPKVTKAFHSDAPDDVWLDLSKIEQLSGKTQYVDLQDGLKQTISWVKKYGEVSQKLSGKL
jgi:UDP-glucuronate decarboxylase